MSDLADTKCNVPAIIIVYILYDTMTDVPYTAMST